MNTRRITSTAKIAYVTPSITLRTKAKVDGCRWYSIQKQRDPTTISRLLITVHAVLVQKAKSFILIWFLGFRTREVISWCTMKD